MSSPTSPDTPSGFAIHALIGKGPRGSVYVATQTGLGRDVALKLYRSRACSRQWPVHPGVARLYAAGQTERGGFTASQLAPGGSLAARLAAGDIAREDALALCEQAARTLGDLDVAHGALDPGNVLIDANGDALLCDFGMPDVEPSPAADREALESLRALCAALPSRRVRRRRRAAVLAVAGAFAVVAVVGAAVAIDRDGDREAAPRPIAGASVLGSGLDGSAPTTLGCDGLPPSGSAPGCTIVQRRRNGRAAVFAADGAVRRWSVRGARGELALQIVRRRRRGRYAVAVTAQRETVTGPGVDTFATDLPVRRGDFAAVQLLPGAGIGALPGEDAATARFVGPLRFEPRLPQTPTGTDLDARIELRVEYIPGAASRHVPTLSGAAARAAPAGRRLASSEVELPDGAVRTVAVTLVGEHVALDLLRGDARLTRMDVVGADPAGTLQALEQPALRRTFTMVAWRNPDGRVVVHDYRATADRLAPVD